MRTSGVREQDGASLSGRISGEASAGHYVGGVMVKPSRRCRGFASALTQARLMWIWSHSDRAYYFANEHNTASIRLHETLSFRPLPF
ncbi:GNAT family N-acetyltransferase [Arthrobacter sp. H41]|uniref:GNAT family N-acetyltransferase n=1 Tax=Arthrobacter sp. H41 TaxID=1312978 RepID=UPI004037A871